MILQRLYEYYQRKAADPNCKDAPPFGYDWNNKLSLLILIDEDGNFIRIEQNEVPFLVPRPTKRAGGNFQPNILWDKEEYILGTFDNDQRKHEQFKKSIIEDFPENIKEFRSIKAVINFYYTNQIENLKKSSYWEMIKKEKNPNMAFKIIGENSPVASCKILKDYVVSKELNSIVKKICSITGEKTVIAKTHQKTFINADANLLVSFQKDSGYDSYGKEQAYNASIGIPAEFAYTTALKMLLEKGSGHELFIAGSKIIFWADKQNIFEDNFSFFFKANNKDDPDKDIQALKSALESIYSGKLNDDVTTSFFVLGLCQGGGSRISVRFWKTGKIKDFAKNIKMHFDDLEIIKSKKDEHDYFTLFNILSNISLEFKVDNAPPNLAGAIIESFLDGTPYPATLQQQCIRRIRAEQHINRIRAAILKAYLNRKIINNNEKQITMALDKENKNQGYLCGRIFAVLEKIQEEAQPGINSTIKDRFYGAASSTPVTVFGRLFNLSNHHLEKLHPGRKTNLEKLKQEIIWHFSSSGMPAHLSLDDQSRFAIGYYHQRQDLFTSKEKEN